MAIVKRGFFVELVKSHKTNKIENLSLYVWGALQNILLLMHPKLQHNCIPTSSCNSVNPDIALYKSVVMMAV